MGSEQFLTLVTYSLLVSHTLMVAVAYTLSGYMYDSGYHTCAVGFSAVLFSLKYALNHVSPGLTNVWGISVPMKYAAWLELVLVSFISPRASFVGHLCGIFAGITYIHIPRLMFGTNANTHARTHSSNHTQSGRTGSRGGLFGRASYTYASGSVNQEPQSRPAGEHFSSTGTGRDTNASQNATRGSGAASRQPTGGAGGGRRHVDEDTREEDSGVTGVIGGIDDFAAPALNTDELRKQRMQRYAKR
jgi:hypothetical protein